LTPINYPAARRSANPSALVDQSVVVDARNSALLARVLEGYPGAGRNGAIAAVTVRIDCFDPDISRGVPMGRNDGLGIALVGIDPSRPSVASVKRVTILDAKTIQGL
jgi:hypothetical protein